MLFGKKKKEEKKVKEGEKIPDIKAVKLPLRPANLASKILIKPVITEKATNLQNFNQYVFEVGYKANKIEIKKAIKELYNIEPKEIKIVKVRGKQVRYGKAVGRTSNWKKAIVTLKKGEKIEFIKK